MKTELDRILKAAIEEFDEKGIRFTMDELAERLGISKRTLYEQIESKDKIVELLVAQSFQSIKDQEREILADTSLDLVEKLRRVICIMPTLVGRLDYRRAHEIRKFYPAHYETIQNHLAGDWESTLALVNQGIAENRLRPVNVPVLKEILYATMESLLADKFLSQNSLTYDEAMVSALDILFEGLVRKEP